VNPAERILGVEGGGTKTAWVLVERHANELRILDQGKLPPSNFRLAPPERLRSIFQQLPPQVDRVGIFLAGCGTPEDRHRLSQIAAEVWPSAKIITGSDRDSGMAAALGHGEGIVVNAGSGSSITGRRGDRIEKAGGWGHILGDAGGGYSLSIQALRLILREYDLHRGEVQFTATALHITGLKAKKSTVCSHFLQSYHYFNCENIIKQAEIAIDIMGKKKLMRSASSLLTMQPRSVVH